MIFRPFNEKIDKNQLNIEDYYDDLSFFIELLSNKDKITLILLDDENDVGRYGLLGFIYNGKSYDTTKWRYCVGSPINIKQSFLKACYSLIESEMSICYHDYVKSVNDAAFIKLIQTIEPILKKAKINRKI